jgi:uncharacterized protein with HEPN domain
MGDPSGGGAGAGASAFMPSSDLYVASMLANFFEAGWSVQVLVGDADQAQYEASRLARPEAEKHLRHMSEIARALPEDVRAQMPKVDWQCWSDLGDYLPPRDAHARSLVWTAIHAWLPPDGQAMRRYRRQLPQLWRFKL